MNFEYVFKLSKDEALERLTALGDYLSNRPGIRAVWSQDTATIQGRYLVVNIDAKMKVDDGVVRVTGKDPGMLWRKKAVGYLTRKLGEYLDQAVPVDQLPRGR